MRIYLARSISGLGYEEVVQSYKEMLEPLRRYYRVFYAAAGKEYLRNGIEFRAKGYEGIPASTNHAIIERDRWMVMQSDIVLVNLLGTKSVSIGCMMELAWAHDHGKHTIVVVEPENVHYHAFVLEAADIIYNNLNDALDYLVGLEAINDC